MAYIAKTDWVMNDTVQPEDMNRIETGIQAADRDKLDKTANAVSASKLQTARTVGINGGATGTPTSFDGSGNIIIPVTSLDATKLSGTAAISTTGNAGSATKLQTARTVALSGVTATPQSFDGSGNITIPVTAVPAALVSGTLSNNTSGNAATATKLQTPRSIALSGGVTGTATNFDGSGNISIPVTAINPNNLSAAVPLSKGGTGATTAASARSALGAPSTHQVNTITKYNTVTFTRTQDASQTVTVTPIPKTGWVQVVLGTEYTSGGYRIKSNGTNSTNYVTLAVDGDTNTRWMSTSQTAPFFQVELPAALVVQKVKVQMPLTQNITGFKIQGSNNGTSWTDLYSGGIGQFTGQLIELTLTSTGSYKFYRAAFTASSVTMFSLYEFQFSQYIIEGYTTAFSITGVSTDWLDNQRLLIYIPSNYNVFGVTVNTLNDIPIDRILEPNKYYELRYSGNTFYSKEV